MYSFLMFFATIFMLAGMVLLPYFIYLKAKKQQPKILPDILKYKRRVGVAVLASALIFAGLAGATPEGQELARRQKESEKIQSVKNETKESPKKEDAEDKKRLEAEAQSVAEKAAATSEVKKGGLYKVLSTTDGDTISIDYKGKAEKVRLVGLDTPETKDPRKPVQCFGREASAKMKELVDGKNVYIEFDATQGERDKYGRLLLFIFTEDGQNVAYKMISEGYGNEYTYNSNPYKYQTQFKKAQAEAREVGRGLWAANTCAGDATKPADAGSSTSTPNAQSSQSEDSGECDIKGNINRKGEKIYHVPGGAYYEKTDPEQIFCSEAEAQSAGFRKSLR